MEPNHPDAITPRRVPPLPLLLFGGFLVLVAMVAGGLTYFAFTNPRPDRQDRLAVLGEVHDFRLTNQLGQAVTLADLRSNVWVVDVIFTRCAGPCPRMSQRMSELQGRLRFDGQVRLVSLTADPAFDTPTVLQHYAERFRADPSRWQFLTGPQAELYRLAARDLLLAVVENPGGASNAPSDLFVHSTKLILLDRQARLRGVFDGENPKVVSQLVPAVRKLLRERS